MSSRVCIAGVDTAKLPKLTSSDMEELMIKVKLGDERARERFVVANLRLVLSVVHRFCAKGNRADDMFQVGCVGLLKAIDNFDVTLNVKFSTYAVPMIIGEIRRYLRDNNSIRVSRSIRDTAYKAIYTKELMMKKSDKEPTVEEIAKKLEIAPEDIVFALDAIQSPVSLYEPVYAESGYSIYIMDQISVKKNKEDNWIEEISLKAAINRLSDREHKIINMRYFEGKTQMEVAEEINISQAQVSRLEKKALRSMKNYLG